MPNMELNPLEECRALIRQQNETTLSQRLRQRCLRLPSDRTIGFGIMISLLISIVLLLVMQLYSSNNDFPLEFPDFVEDDDDYFNNTDDRSIFVEAWKREKIKLKYEREQLLSLNEVLIQKSKNPHSDMELFFEGNETMPMQLSDCALILENVKRSLKKCISVDILPEECLRFLRDTTECDSEYPYRTINGSCNNLIHPTWGISGAPYLRLLKPHYSDGTQCKIKLVRRKWDVVFRYWSPTPGMDIRSCSELTLKNVSTLRLSVYGVDLPNPRLLSSRIYERKLRPNAETTMMFMNYGLFLDHDFIKSVLPFKDILIHCCEPEVKANPKLRHPACGEIKVPMADPFFIKRNITCMNFYRSTPSIGKCPGRREQANVMTAYLDLSDTYGPTNEESKSLRSFKRGKLEYSLIGNTPVLPFSNDTGRLCYTRSTKYQCFRSGDVRVNMHIEIMVLHTIWMREHNRIAEILQNMNPHWSEEKIFQEARRINIAEFQHITYNEFLPNIFGKQRMKRYGLEINPNKKYDGYDETVQSGVYNSFASAVFRFGHTLVQSVWEFRGPDYKIRSRIPLREVYTNPEIIYKHGMDDIIRGMASQRTYQPDRHTTKELRNRLLQRYYSDYGLDLSMITIQRGRDRGLPSYTKWRKFCGLEEIRSWDDMYKVMDKVRADEVREMYMSVDDVDLVTGGLSEYPLEGALVGPTYACILWRQFRNARVSDRFWFENKNQAGSFTSGQLAEIYKSSFARILCDTSDDLKTIQKFPFRIRSAENPMVSCDSLQNVDLSLWADDQNE